MTTNEVKLKRRLSRINRWWLPFLWIILTPLVTVPASVAVSESLGARHTAAEVGLPEDVPGANYGWCPDGDDPFGQCVPNFFAPTYEYYEVTPTLVAFLLPGLISVAPFTWRFSRHARTRKAGMAAGLAGLLRIVMPALVLFGSFDRLTGAGGGSYFQVETTLFGWEPFSTVWGLGFFAWVGSLILWFIFWWRTRAKTTPAGPPLVSAQPRSLPQEKDGGLLA